MAAVFGAHIVVHFFHVELESGSTSVDFVITAFVTFEDILAIVDIPDEKEQKWVIVT